MVICQNKKNEEYETLNLEKEKIKSLMQGLDSKEEAKQVVYCKKVQHSINRRQYKTAIFLIDKFNSSTMQVEVRKNKLVLYFTYNIFLIDLNGEFDIYSSSEYSNWLIKDEPTVELLEFDF